VRICDSQLIDVASELILNSSNRHGAGWMFLVSPCARRWITMWQIWAPVPSSDDGGRPSGAPG
jgi:hypothetical protein